MNSLQNWPLVDKEIIQYKKGVKHDLIIFQLYIYDCSIISPYALMLFGGEMSHVEVSKIAPSVHYLKPDCMIQLNCGNLTTSQVEGRARIIAGLKFHRLL